MKLTTNASAYFTHQPVLVSVLRATQGPVLELGMGYGSTPLLHELCSTRKRLVVSVEAEAQWFAQFKGHANPFHQLLKVAQWDTSFFNDLAAPAWSVVFVDQGLWQNRIEAVAFFRDKADFLVLHDSDWFASNATPVASVVNGSNVYHFRYTQEFIPPAGGPPTAVVSDVHPCEFTVDWALTEVS